MTGRDDVEMAVQMDRLTRCCSGVAPDDVYAGVALGVLDAACGRQQLHARAMRAKLLANHARARLVLFSWRIDGRNTNQPRGEIDDLVSSTLDFSEHTIGHGEILSRPSGRACRAIGLR